MSSPSRGAAARRVAELLDRHRGPIPPSTAAGAAVLILLRPDRRGEDIEVLLIERSVRPGDPGSGQVALPGGRVEAWDATLAATALRETREEVGITPGDLAAEPRYVRTDSARAFGLTVGIFAAPLAPRARAPTPAQPEEVAATFWLPTRLLRSPSRVTRATPRGPIQVPAAVHEGHVLWGFTFRALQEFFELPVSPGPEGPDVSPPPAA